MTNYSTGTWKVVTDHAGLPAKIISEDFKHVCSFVGSVKKSCGTKEIAANANLIASVPELLEALEFLVDATESLCSAVEEKGWKPNKANHAVIQGKRTLKKAKK